MRDGIGRELCKKRASSRRTRAFYEAAKAKKRRNDVQYQGQDSAEREAPFHTDDDCRTEGPHEAYSGQFQIGYD